MVTDAVPTQSGCHANLAIEASNIHKGFLNMPVLKGLNLELQAASVFALLGPNGAGKSTLISLLTGVSRADQGRLRILGIDPAEDPLAVKRLIGVVPEELALFERLTGRQQLHFCAKLHGLDRTTSEQRCEELLRLTDLVSAGNQLIGTYSKGMRRRLAIAAALIHGPALVFLDEPFDGIDVIAAGVIRELLQELRRAQVSLLLTTHILEIADRIATHAGFLYDGRLLDQGPVAALTEKYQRANLEGVFETLIPLPNSQGHRLSFYQPRHAEPL
jgi:ABC-2 type transport system ATP-binding protein